MPSIECWNAPVPEAHCFCAKGSGSSAPLAIYIVHHGDVVGEYSDSSVANRHLEMLAGVEDCPEFQDAYVESCFSW